MQAQGQIQITEELSLLNPTMEIVKVNYDWINHSVDVEIYFSEGSFNHSRTFTFSTDGRGELTSNDILTFLSEHPVLSQFK